MEKTHKIRKNLMVVVRDGTPVLSAFASWVLDHLDEVAFQSIRGLAAAANVNANTVTRLAHELGYDGFDAFKHDVQTLLKNHQTYSDRARALSEKTGADVWDETLSSNWSNVQTLFNPETQATLNSCITPLLQARHVYSIGVRSCFSVAHYFGYVGAMAFGNFAPVPNMPGAILDQIANSTEDDIVVAITYEHYSAEVVRACQVARETGARILALTDSYASPIAKGAWQVIKLPMGGPQLLPSLTTAFITAELLLTAMIAQSPTAAQKVGTFEQTITRHGGYFKG